MCIIGINNQYKKQVNQPRSIQWLLRSFTLSFKTHCLDMLDPLSTLGELVLAHAFLSTLFRLILTHSFQTSSCRRFGQQCHPHPHLICFLFTIFRGALYQQKVRHGGGRATANVAMPLQVGRTLPLIDGGSLLIVDSKSHVGSIYIGHCATLSNDM